MYWRIILISLFGLLVGTGCFQKNPRADLVLLNGAEPESLDPAIVTGQPEMRIVSSLFEGLTATDAKNRVVPGVAERWEISNQGRCYRFFLRNTARWSNGDPVISSDFLLSWKRTLDPLTASEYAYQLFSIRNAEDFNSGKLKDFSKVGIRAPSSSCLEVTLENPTPYFLSLCAFPTLMPIHLNSLSKYGDDWIKPGKLISNGPFILDAWRINNRIRIVKNPHYWDRQQVRLNHVEILPIHKANTALNLYHSKVADLIIDKGLIPSALLSELRKKIDFHSSSYLGTYFYRFNVMRKPFQDMRVRKAFTQAINKQQLVDRVTRAGEMIANSLVPPGMEGYTSPQGLGFDVSAARKWLAEAGYPNGKNFPVVTLLYNQTEQNEAIATSIQAMLKENLGVTVQLRQQEWKVYLNSMSQLDYDFCRASWVGDYVDPNTFLDMFVTQGGNNRTGWSNAKYDELIRKSARETSAKRRLQLFQEAETLLCCDELPILPLYYFVGIQFYDAKKIHGIEPNLLDDHPLKWIWVEKMSSSAN